MVEPSGHCPYLGLKQNQAIRFASPTPEHRCFASGQAQNIPLTPADYQSAFCLSPDHIKCPLYTGQGLPSTTPIPLLPQAELTPAAGSVGGWLTSLPRRDRLIYSALIALLGVILVVYAVAGFGLFSGDGFFGGSLPPGPTDAIVVPPASATATSAVNTSVPASPTTAAATNTVAPATNTSAPTSTVAPATNTSAAASTTPVPTQAIASPTFAPPRPTNTPFVLPTATNTPSPLTPIFDTATAIVPTNTPPPPPVEPSSTVPPPTSEPSSTSPPPTEAPTEAPTATATFEPQPTEAATEAPTELPTEAPTDAPTTDPAATATIPQEPRRTPDPLPPAPPED